MTSITFLLFFTLGRGQLLKTALPTTQYDNFFLHYEDDIKNFYKNVLFSLTVQSTHNFSPTIKLAL
jgi:hypothetical protein